MKKQSIHQTLGFTLISLMIGVALSAFLLLIVGQLTSNGRENYIQSKNLMEMNDNARDAIAFLQQNIQVAGFGISQPVTAINRQLNTATPPPASGVPPYGGFAVLPDWTYIGYYQENTPTRLFPNVIMNSPTDPTSCANKIASTSADSDFQFFGLQFSSQCWGPPHNPPKPPFDKSTLVVNTADNTATCCNPGSCNTPNYNCGGNLQNAVYQKLMAPVCVAQTGSTAACTGAPSSISPIGETLSVYYSNPGPNSFTTFSGQAVPAATTQPAPLNSYTFQVVQNGTNYALQAIDSMTGLTTYNIASNIEYMVFMMGESDLNINTVSPWPSYTLPTLSRYVEYDTLRSPYRVTSVRVAIVVRSSDQIVKTGAVSNILQLMRGDDGAWLTYTTPNDEYLRQVYVTTIYLKNYQLPEYRTHCVNVGGTYYIKTGGIPFSPYWTTNDECCGGSPCATYPSFSNCETQRMLGGC